MKKISVCVTNYNRFESTINSIANIINDDRVDSIVILDDKSTDESGIRLSKYFAEVEKVTVGVQLKNVGMQQNKAEAVFCSPENWCILLDSDNEISTDYIDKLYALPEWKENTIYAPARALPQFIYDGFAGQTITKKNVKDFVKVPLFGALINTSNYFVNSLFYAKVYELNPEIKGVDTANHFYNHISKGGEFYVVPDLEYFHAISPDSEFMKEVHFNMKCAADIDRKLLTL